MRVTIPKLHTVEIGFVHDGVLSLLRYLSFAKNLSLLLLKNNLQESLMYCQVLQKIVVKKADVLVRYHISVVLHSLLAKVLPKEVKREIA
jgi:predicted PP-loop superfamily ATPase